jgi:signal transduction histidine kinase
MHIDDSGSTFRSGDAGNVFAGGGEVAALLRSTDWAATPLGPMERWPQSLRTALSMCLSSRYPMFLYWSPELVQIYNEAGAPIMGDKHPEVFGKPVREALSEIWDYLSPLFDAVHSTGEATWQEDAPVFLNRRGSPEECYFIFSYTPILDESGGIGGVYTPVTETTGKVVGERRLRALHELAAQLAEVKTEEAVYEAALRVLGGDPHDVPFALLYAVETDQRTARLAGAVGLDERAKAKPEAIDLKTGEAPSTWPLGTAVRTGRTAEVHDLEMRFGDLPGGPWVESPRVAALLPVMQANQSHPTAVLVAGVSPRRPWDDEYRHFLELAAGQIGTALARARAYEAEKRRAEALAELDRAKMQFFSNVSHEFRTPLTLMLGPLEDLRAAHGIALPDPVREELDVVYRNALRLLRLVNTLLDFSRIEAGRAQASFEPTDLSAYTAELASNFRSAAERAGLGLEVDTPPLPEHVYVDREMWEKVVLNLLSNAFKHTFEGKIGVSLRWAGDHIEVEVCDTGTGIPEEELPHLFERFRRVEGAQSRTHEGTGIGLALVKEVVDLHGGTVRVESTPGQGSTFTVAIPTGSAHLPAELVHAPRTLASTALGATPYVEEALRWLPNGPIGAEEVPREAEPVLSTRPSSVSETDTPTPSARILVADDNADMRDYLRRLLAGRWEVEAVADGQAALDAVRERVPDLILSDVMMPGLDGFALLRELRSDPRTRAIPVVLLSARAGEESAIEGLEAGADDYLVKPFSARELLARVRTQLEMARVRQGAEEKERLLVEAEEANRTKSEFLATMSHELRTPLNAILGYVDLMQMGVPAPLPQAVQPQAARIQASARHLLHLIDEVLSFSRIEAGREVLDVEAVNLRELVQEAAIFIEPLAAPKGLRFDVDAERAPVSVETDPRKVRQILINLLGNAVKFTEHGHVSLTVEQEDGAVVFRVRDTGIGIAPEHRERLFEAFWQVDQSRTRTASGTGLGLSVSRKLAQLLGAILRWRACPVREAPSPSACRSARESGARAAEFEKQLALTSRAP